MDFETASVDILPLRVAVGFSTVEAELGFLPLRRAVEFFGSRPAEINGDLKHHKMHCALGWSQHSMVSRGF